MSFETAPNVAPPRPVPVIVRLLSGLGAIAVFLIGMVVSVGAILAAPLGMWLVARWTTRRHRAPSRIASLFGAVLASSVLAALLWSVLFFLAPRPDPKELESAVAQSQQSVQLPEWYTKTFPQTARADSATKELTQSPGFLKFTLVMSVGFLALFCGVLGGALGWGSAVLFRVARS
jgi:hypothetical protein